MIPIATKNVAINMLLGVDFLNMILSSIAQNRGAEDSNITGSAIPANLTAYIKNILLSPRARAAKIVPFESAKNTYLIFLV
ncbi:hypothetical protein CFV354_0822 [Campylobacter fetus subsp. venerealis NCTC 10354]|nr:hypothetical protein CFV354_0822 [Campylobacter fetus subsp. venerealis NCTC 10354]PHJ04973.1 hypothetical protein IW23_07310 [Campylobacter fetus subsp. venerealis]